VLTATFPGGVFFAGAPAVDPLWLIVAWLAPD
jgi:hypothetical protein